MTDHKVASFAVINTVGTSNVGVFYLENGGVITLDTPALIKYGLISRNESVEVLHERYPGGKNLSLQITGVIHLEEVRKKEYVSLLAESQEIVKTYFRNSADTNIVNFIQDELKNLIVNESVEEDDKLKQFSVLMEKIHEFLEFISTMIKTAYQYYPAKAYNIYENKIIPSGYIRAINKLLLQLIEWLQKVADYVNHHLLSSAEMGKGTKFVVYSPQVTDTEKILGQIHNNEETYPEYSTTFDHFIIFMKKIAWSYAEIMYPGELVMGTISMNTS